MKKLFNFDKALGLLLTIPLLLISLAGCAPEEEAPEVDFRVSVTAADAERGSVEATIVATGSIRAAHEAALPAPRAGELRVLRNPKSRNRYENGDPVRKGQVIAIVETEESRVSRKSGVEAKLKRLRAAEAELERKERLHGDGVISDSQLQEAESAAATARYDYENSLVEESRVRVEAPITGILAEVTNSGEGEWVNGGHMVAKVVDYGEVIAEAQLGAGDLRFVQLGQRVRVSSYAYPGESFEGTVTSIDPTLDLQARTFGLEARLENPEGLLRPGLFAKIEVIVQEREDVVTVPKEIVLIRDNQDVIYVVEGQKAKQRNVVLGLEGEKNIEIVQGLEEGERVIVRGYETLNDGTPVRVQES
jgi:RND family efflux transporter MFP subunit